MTMRKLFRISFLFVLSQLLYKTVTQQCGSEVSIFGWMLQGHIYDTMLAELPHTCVQVCREDNRCQSFNWVIPLLKCEFSNRTKEARPEDFISDPDRFYYKRDRNRVPLGSIPELPAETCLEIKMSEGHAISRKYWFSSIKTGTSVLAYCDIKTEDIDECTSSVPLCDVNAVCTNNDGSYICICKNGFSGDGKTCKDIDECSSNSHSCDVNAVCGNTVGSYTCACKPGYSGNGRTCSDIDECSTNSHSCNVNAVCSNTVGSYACACKAGFKGDGNTCTDIDECAGGTHNCHSSRASCTNTVGSFSCSCNNPFTGNGKICNLVSGLHDSVIVGNNKNHLTSLSNWLAPATKSVDSLWKRCWRASVDGWDASTFHSRCDGKGPTVTIIRVGRYIFGGYTSISWVSASPGRYQYDSKAFLFSLVNKPGWAPVKLSQTGKYSSRKVSMYSYSSYGPTFGGGHDINIKNDASSNGNSYSNLGHTYSPPSGYSYTSTFARTFLAGTYNFTPDEVETFYERT